MTRRPPVPMPVRRSLRRLMIFALGLVVFGVAVGAGAWRASGDLRSFTFALPAGLFAAALAAHRIALLHHLFFVLSSTAAGWLYGRPGIGLAIGGAYVLYAVFRSRDLPADLTSDGIVPAPDDAVGPGAEGFVREFVRLGYHQVGAYTFRAGGHEIVGSLLTGPGNDRYATVTDAVLTVTSSFGPRSLVTRNSALSSMPPEVLDNPSWGTRPAELDGTHDAALALISPHTRPEILEPGSITALAIESERRSVDWVRLQPTHIQPGRGRGHGPLASHPGAQELIMTWLKAPDAV